MKKTGKLSPIHPGEILKEEFLDAMAISQYRLAKDIQVPPRRINEIVHGKRGISANTALRLAKYFQVTPEFWMNLQHRYDLDRAKIDLEGDLSEIIHPCAYFNNQGSQELRC
jgi:addiction module HigA family antidote